MPWVGLMKVRMGVIQGLVGRGDPGATCQPGHPLWTQPLQASCRWWQGVVLGYHPDPA